MATRHPYSTSNGPVPGQRRLGLVGCVKTKVPHRTTAADLYKSTLFTGRRRFVEMTCDEWFILSALHGLVRPDEQLAPYDTTLTKMSRLERRRWAGLVLASIDDTVGIVPGDLVSLHAGSDYADFGLVDGLVERGAILETPTRGLKIGSQLAFYKAFAEAR